MQRPLSGDATDCLIFLDAELYIERVNAPEIVGEAQAAGCLPPLACSYLSHQDAASRHIDFICNETFSSLLATDLPHWIERPIGRYERVFVCGLSLSGLAAAFAALRHLATFSGALCQTPSAWWKDEWLSASLKPGEARGGRVWISVGNQELDVGVSHPPSGLLQQTSQLDSVRRLARKFDGLCWDVHYNEFSGDHDTARWAHELPDALSWQLQHEG